AGFHPRSMNEDAAAQTIQAQQTNIAHTNQAQIPESTPTATLQPTEQDMPQNTATLIPETTQAPRNTPTQTVVGQCDQASFISETIPDDTVFLPGETFTKTWTIKNNGNCTWDEDYDVVFVKGDAMSAPAAQALDGEVAPGQAVQISVDLQAPAEIGTYRGDFKLRNANDEVFGIGNSDATFWVKIEVQSKPISGALYDFTNQYCSAGVAWSSAAGTLPCPGTSGDNKGWVRRINEPILENGAKENEPGLQVHPQKVNNGWIKGIYPEITLTSDAYFKAIVGCYGTADCNVRFKLNAIVDGGSEQTLASWDEKQDQNFTRVEFNLSEYKNRKIKLILIVEAIGSGDNTSLWLAPRIAP
ncbi:MAG: NBR1-Ig-like domain-containing protein, partial [Anaerolineales bacterium]